MGQGTWSGESLGVSPGLESLVWEGDFVLQAKGNHAGVWVVRGGESIPVGGGTSHGRAVRRSSGCQEPGVVVTAGSHMGLGESGQGGGRVVLEDSMPGRWVRSKGNFRVSWSGRTDRPNVEVAGMSHRDHQILSGVPE